VALSELVQVIPAWADRPFSIRTMSGSPSWVENLPHRAYLCGARLESASGRHGAARREPACHRNLTPYKADPHHQRLQPAVGGEMRLMLDSYRDLLFALALSIASIFLILVPITVL